MELDKRTIICIAIIVALVFAVMILYARTVRLSNQLAESGKTMLKLMQQASAKGAPTNSNAEIRTPSFQELSDQILWWRD